MGKSPKNKSPNVSSHKTHCQLTPPFKRKKENIGQQTSCEQRPLNMIPTSIITRLPAVSIGRVATSLNARALSTHGVEAVEKLRGALEEYRVQK